MLAISMQVGADTHIQFGSNLTLILENVDMAQFTPRDFTDYTPNFVGTESDDVLTGYGDKFGYCGDDYIVSQGGKIDAGDGNDQIFGRGLEILGGAGDDLIVVTGATTIDSGAAEDRMEGGAGNDTSAVDHNGDVVTEDLG